MNIGKNCILNGLSVTIYGYSNYLRFDNKVKIQSGTVRLDEGALLK